MVNQAMPNDLDRVPAVAAFIAHEDKVLVVRRADNIPSYPGKWSGVNSLLQHVPLKQAYLQIAEELGMGTERIRLVGIGAPVRVDDSEHDWDWLVFPYLFELKSGSEVRLNWKATEREWIAPDEIGRLDTVPGLADVLASVWPGFGTPGLWGAARQLSADRTNGSTDIACQALAAVERFRSAGPAPDLPRAARALSSLRPSMGIIPHAMTLVVGGADATKLQQDIQDAGQLAAQTAAEALSGIKSILTHSHSGVCEATLRAWAERGGEEVICTESRPKCEGVVLAKRLAGTGLSVRVITDAQMGLAARQVDALLLGSDAITGDGYLVNKAGTELAAIAAEAAGKRVCVVCQTHKIAPPGWPIALEHQDPKDVLDARHIRAQNVIFDAVSIDRLQAVITERGPLTDDLLREVNGELAASPLLHLGSS